MVLPTSVCSWASNVGAAWTPGKNFFFFFAFYCSEWLKVTALTTILQIICERFVSMRYMTQIVGSTVFHHQLNVNFPWPCFGVIWRQLGKYLFLEKFSQTFGVVGLTWEGFSCEYSQSRKPFLSPDHSETTWMRSHFQVIKYRRFGLAGRANPLDLKVW